ncbi:19446_t:CDS:2 [Funneliformis geosporum]|nr:19446_t:CDS:2 [Funneliformis geosporum]
MIKQILQEVLSRKRICKKHNGHTVITKLLISNNSIAAIKRLDLLENRLMKHLVMKVHGSSNNNNYANVLLIVNITKCTNVHTA